MGTDGLAEGSEPSVPILGIHPARLGSPSSSNFVGSRLPAGFLGAAPTSGLTGVGAPPFPGVE